MSADKDSTAAAAPVAEVAAPATTAATIPSAPTTIDAAPAPEEKPVAATAEAPAAPIEAKPAAGEAATAAPLTTEAAPAEAAAAEANPAPKPAATPLTKISDRLPDIIKSTEHGEMWGVQLGDPSSHVPTKIVLQKFLRANANDAAAAEKQLEAALRWRKKFQPLALLEKTFDYTKFGGVGYLTTHKDDSGKETVFTWNIYGAVKNNKATFGNVDEFIQWRAALMELGTHKLNINAATQALPEDGTGEDPYQMIQVHDYKSVSFLRADPAVKAATKQTIDMLSTAYPELLAHKYFVNVLAIMGWMYAAMKLFLPATTLKKFHPMTSGTSLAAELPSIASTLPVEYGGKGLSVTEGQTVKLTAPELQKKEEIPPAAGEAPVAAAVETKPAATTEEAKPAAPAEEAKPATTTEEAKPVTGEAKPAVEENKAEDKPAEVKAA